MPYTQLTMINLLEQEKLISLMNGIKNKICDIGIMIGDKSSWGKGYASEVINVISRYAFRSLNVNKLTAGAISPNIGVIKAFLKMVIKKKADKKMCKCSEWVDGSCLTGCFKNELKDDD